MFDKITAYWLLGVGLMFTSAVIVFLTFFFGTLWAINKLMA